MLSGLTEHNPNLLFELGVRMASAGPIALVKATGTNPIFDIDHMLRVASYNPNVWPSTVSADVPKLGGGFEPGAGILPHRRLSWTRGHRSHARPVRGLEPLHRAPDRAAVAGGLPLLVSRGHRLLARLDVAVLQYVFPLDDPRGVAPLAHPGFSEDEWAAIDRYLTQARDLAGSTVLTARNGYSVYMVTMDSEPEITETKSARDVTIGFLTMLRQFYSHDELASFTRVAKLVSREMHRAGLDDLQMLTTWRKAHATLRHTHLDHLILVQAAADAHVPQHLADDNAFHPNSIVSPELMISAIFYGDAIHWGDQRSIIEAWGKDSAVMAVKRKFDVLRCAVHLGHLYVGFAGLVGLITGRLGLGDV